MVEPGEHRVIVRPVLDLAGHQPVDSYEIPDRIRPAGHRTRPPLRLPALHQTGRVLRPRPHRAPRRRRSDLCLQPRAPVPRPPPAQDRRPRLLPDAQPRHLPLDPALGDLPGRPHRHPPTHRVDSARPARGVATQPHTPPPAGLQACPGVSIRPRAALLGPTRPTAQRPRPPVSLSRPQPQRAPQAAPRPGRARGDSAVTHDGEQPRPSSTGDPAHRRP